MSYFESVIWRQLFRAPQYRWKHRLAYEYLQEALKIVATYGPSPALAHHIHCFLALVMER